ncbi:hypothetical protein ACLB2K_046206 [Fragaria x ananassa]
MFFVWAITLIAHLLVPPLWRLFHNGDACDQFFTHKRQATVEIEVSRMVAVALVRTDHQDEARSALEALLCGTRLVSGRRAASVVARPVGTLHGELGLPTSPSRRAERQRSTDRPIDTNE